MLKLKWECPRAGEWTASSKWQPKGKVLFYRIFVRLDGQFDLSTSDPELLGNEPPSFKLLSSAQEWCEIKESQGLAPKTL